MTIKTRAIPGLFMIIALLSIFFTGTAVSRLVSAVSIDIPFESTQTFTIVDDTNFYLMYDRHRESNDYYGVEDTTFFTLDVDGQYEGSYNITVKNTDSNMFYVIKPMRSNTTVTINDSFAVGTLNLPAGNYLVMSTVVSGEDTGDFAFSNRGFIWDIFLAFFSVFGIIIGIVLGVITFGIYSRNKTQDNVFYESKNIYSTKETKQTSAFDDEDPFSKYD